VVSHRVFLKNTNARVNLGALGPFALNRSSRPKTGTVGNKRCFFIFLEVYKPELEAHI
jgi:hypothetical protein